MQFAYVKNDYFHVCRWTIFVTVVCLYLSSNYMYIQLTNQMRPYISSFCVNAEH